MDRTEFFDLLYGEDCSGQYLGIVDLASKQTGWYGAVDTIPNGKQEVDQYFNVGLQGSKLPAGKRGSAKTVVAIPGLWADVDFTKADEKKPYPTEEQARAAIAAMPLRPSVVVHSGRGLHLYWLFPEPIELATQDDRDAAGSLCKRWQSLLRSKLGGPALDSTADISRMLRVPGSLHGKAGREVTVEDSSGLRYDADSFADLLPEAEVKDAKSKESRVVDVDYNPDASPSVDKLFALIENDPAFRKVWDHKAGFPSSSEYDLSIASRTLAMAWTDQEVTDTIIAWRRRHGLLDGWRLDKAVRAINVANDAKEEGASWKTLTESSAELKEIAEIESPTDDERQDQAKEADHLRGACIIAINRLTGLNLKQWVKYGVEGAVYYAILEDGRRVKMGGSKSWFASPSAFASTFIDAIDFRPKIDRKRWGDLVDALTAIVEPHSLEGSAVDEYVIDTIGRYIRSGHALDESQLFHGLTDTTPVKFDDGSIGISIAPLMEWAKKKAGDMPGRMAVMAVLKESGWTRKTLTAHSPERKESVTRSYYLGKPTEG